MGGNDEPKLRRLILQNRTRGADVHAPYQQAMMTVTVGSPTSLDFVKPVSESEPVVWSRAGGSVTLSGDTVTLLDDRPAQLRWDCPPQSEEVSWRR